MKEIESIIDNQDHKRLTEALSERVKELAAKVRVTLGQLQELTVSDYYIAKSRANNGSIYEYLAVEYDGLTMSLEDDSERYYCDDSSCKIIPATNALKLAFLNKAKDIFKTLDEQKNKECSEIEKALNETAEL